MRLKVAYFILFYVTCVFSKAARRKRNAEDTAEMARYFGTYTQLRNSADGVARVGYSSEDGSTTMDLADTPGFIERVMDMQEAAGLKQTGEVSKELLKEARQARCGVSDPPRDSDELGAYTVKTMWDSKYIPQSQIYSLTFSILNQDEIPDGLDGAELEEGILSAMCLWESYSNIRFKNVGNDNMLADVTVSFAQGDHGDWYSFDGRGGTLAHAFYPENGRLHFDKTENWYLARKHSVDHFKRDIFTVAAHELGHNIGLMHSQKRGALMAPVYKYAGTVEEYELTDDDVAGVNSMYGRRIESNPAFERGTACFELRTKYGVRAEKLRDTSTRARVNPTAKILCRDEKRYRKYCPRWKNAGYCDDPIHGRTLRRKCKKSCGFCPVKPMKKKPKSKNDAGRLSNSVCGIEKFDSVAVILDARNVVNMLYFKDDYYFESSLIIDGNTTADYSLLDTNEEMSETITWRTDPKTIKVGNYKIQQPEMFEKSKQIDAVILAKSWYLAFEKGSNLIHKYSLGTPTVIYLGNFTVKSIFHGYPHDKVDAGFVEFDVGDNNDTVYSLFHHNLMWQYREIKGSDPTEQLDKQKLELLPIPSKQGVPIEQWHGVAACNIDAVIAYKGMPYFVKDNIFWPAVDTEPMIPRDLTYNFLRCWEEEPPVNPTPPLCDATFGSQTANDDSGNGVSRVHASTIFALLTMFASFINFA